MAELTAGFEDWVKARPGFESHLAIFSSAVDAVRDGGNAPNIEWVLQLLADVSALKRAAGESVVSAWSPPFHADSDELEALSGLIREYMRDRLFNLPDPASGDYLHGLLDLGPHGSTDVFTLNYDQLVESMAVRFDVRFTTGFGESWDPRLFDQLEGTRLRLFKLHGSVDWFRLPDRNVIFRGAGIHPAFPGASTVDVLLYPGRGKNALADPYATLMAYFADGLSKADFCIVVGYSFRDTHIRRAVLDRMATNPKLQLIIVDPQANDVMEVKPEEAGEPSFAQVADRVAGLWQSARIALENRMIGFRVREIESADDFLNRARERISARDFRDAARLFFQAVDYCHSTDLWHKPIPFTRLPVGDELRQEMAQELLNKIAGCARGLKIDDRDELAWQGVSPGAAAQELVRLLQYWLVAAGLELHEEAATANGHLRFLAHQYVRGTLFIEDTRIIVWGTTHPWHGPEQDTQARASHVQAGAAGINARPPTTGLLLASEKPAREVYAVFVDGLRALDSAFHALTADGAETRDFADLRAFCPQGGGWRNRVEAWSSAFLASEFPKAWLEAPTIRRQ